MKFLCDRCKTRYSIGDDRVRGKILKIRCKNCANVITVREGMPEPAELEAADRRRPASVAPPTSTGALGAAFASQLAKPPPDLEEEWYVSIDGKQAGPFSLADAQRWVAAQAFSAELHCWSEGFDDWLPTDKVSHFRGLRRQPAAKRPTIPPPIPAPAPKPLFAATMASIERAAVTADRGSTRPAMSQAHPIATRANGMEIGPTNDIDAPTMIDAPVFQDEAATVAERHANRRLEKAELPRPRRSTAQGAPVPSAAASGVPLPDDDALEIGEVSRVVKLAEVDKKGKARAATVERAIPGARGSAPRLTPTELGMRVDPAFAKLSDDGEPVADDSVVARSFAQRHRRGMMILIAASAVMVLGVIVLVVVVVSGPHRDLPDTVGGMRQIDMSRPEDIVRRQLPPPPNAGSSAPASVQHSRSIGNRQLPINQNPVDNPDPSGSALSASEIEDVAAKNNEGTRRCYLRAQRGAIGMDIAELKKIDVTLTVNKDGAVTGVVLSSHGGDSFGDCLLSRIRSWRFRESRGGTFRIALAFTN